jgi:hypothetical protein
MFSASKVVGCSVWSASRVQSNKHWSQHQYIDAKRAVSSASCAQFASSKHLNNLQRALVYGVIVEHGVAERFSVVAIAT